MDTINVIIGGTQYLTIKDTFQAKQEITYKVDSCQFNVISATKPTEYSEVIITDQDSTKIFAGVIVSSQLVDRLTNEWNITCNDYSSILDRKLVVEDYTSASASFIFNDIITKYVDASFTSVGVLSGASTINAIQFNYVKVTECFKQLCDYVGWQWYVDYDKDIKFFPAGGVLGTAPEEITSILQVDQLDFSLDVQDLRNRVYVLGGSELSDPYTYEIKADGLARAWILPHKPHNISISFNEIPLTVGIENVDSATAVDTLVNFNEKRVLAGVNLVTPVDGETLSFTYQYDVDIITLAENPASQAAIAAIQGTDGIYEYQIVDTTLTTIEAAEAAGQKEINQFSDPYVEGSYITRTKGYQAGQLVTINLPSYGINNTYMINSVISQFRSNQWEFVIQFGGRLLSVADYLQALISNLNNADKVSPTEVLKKFITTSETATLADELTTTTRDITSPWYIEDSVKFRVNAVTATETSALYTAVGTYLILSTNDRRGWGTNEYYNGTAWTTIQIGELVELGNTVLQVRSDRNIEAYNFKIAYTETDVVCGEVVVLSA